MDDDLKSKLEHCRGEHAAPLSLPPQTYRDDQVVEEEIAQIFRRQWIGLGRGDLVKNPGDYICLDPAGQSIILLRDKSGQIQAFAILAAIVGHGYWMGQGRSGIICPFHSWAYKLSGELAGAPRMDEKKMIKP